MGSVLDLVSPFLRDLDFSNSMLTLLFPSPPAFVCSDSLLVSCFVHFFFFSAFPFYLLSLLVFCLLHPLLAIHMRLFLPWYSLISALPCHPYFTYPLFHILGLLHLVSCHPLFILFNFCNSLIPPPLYHLPSLLPSVHSSSLACRVCPLRSAGSSEAVHHSGQRRRGL